MKKYIIIILLFFSQPSFSSGLDFYVRSELGYFLTNHYNSISVINLHIGLRAKIIKIAEVKISYGFSYYIEEYTGFNASFIVEKEIYKNYKFLFGINSHFNNGVSHGTTVYVKSYDKTFLSYIIGSGINLSDNSSIDLQLYIPNENEYGYSFESTLDGFHHKVKNVNYIFKIGFEFYFNLIK